MHELRGAPEKTLAELLGKLAPVDLVLIEGFKRDRHPKLEIHRQANGKPLIYPDDPQVKAIAADVAMPDAPVPWVSLNDIAAIVDILLANAVPIETMTGARPLARSPVGTA